MSRQTAFHARTSALARWMADDRGFTVPAAYAPLAEEYAACRERVALLDRTALRKWEVVGPDALVLLQGVLTRDVRRLGVGEIAYAALCHEDGGLRDHATVWRLSHESFRLVADDPGDGAFLLARAAQLGLERVWVKETTDEQHGLAVQGPRSRELLAGLVWTPPTGTPVGHLRWFRFTDGRLGGPQGPELIVARTGYTGELGYDVLCRPADGPALWDALWSAGAPLGVGPVGLDALDVLRLEAGFVMPGREFDASVDPFEAGIAAAVELGEEPFVGRHALVARSFHPRRATVGLRPAGRVGPGDAVVAGGETVGVVTSAAVSPGLGGAVLAMARVLAAHGTIGTLVEAGGQRAEVVALPFRDPARSRVRA